MVEKRFIFFAQAHHTPACNVRVVCVNLTSGAWVCRPDLVRCSPPMFLAGVVWRGRCETHLSLLELDYQSRAFCFCFGVLAVTTAGGRVSVICAGRRALTPHKENDACHVVCMYMVRHPRGSYICSIPIAVSGSSHTQKSFNSFEIVVHCKSASQAVLSINRMWLTFHAARPTPHGASRLVPTNVCLVGENSTSSVRAL